MERGREEKGRERRREETDEWRNGEGERREEMEER